MKGFVEKIYNKDNSTLSISLLREMLYTYGYMDIFNIYKVENGEISIVDLYETVIDDYEVNIKGDQVDVKIHNIVNTLNGKNIKHEEVLNSIIKNMLYYTYYNEHNMFFKFPFIVFNAYHRHILNLRPNERNYAMNNIIKARVEPYPVVIENLKGIQQIDSINGIKKMNELDYSVISLVPDDYKPDITNLKVEENISISDKIDGYIGISSINIDNTIIPLSLIGSEVRLFSDEFKELLYNDKVIIPLGIKMYGGRKDGGKYRGVQILNGLLIRILDSPSDYINMNTYVKFNTM